MVSGTYENPSVSERDGRWTAHIATRVRTFPVRARGKSEAAAIEEVRKLYRARTDCPLYHWLGQDAENV